MQTINLTPPLPLDGSMHTVVQYCASGLKKTKDNDLPSLNGLQHMFIHFFVMDYI